MNEGAEFLGRAAAVPTSSGRGEPVLALARLDREVRGVVGHLVVVSWVCDARNPSAVLDAIAADNPGVKLPDTDIVVAHRADGSWATDNFTKYLVDAAPKTWTLKSGPTIEWPAESQAGSGNTGVAQIVKSTKGAIGYVDLPDAKASALKYAQIKNKAGKFIEPTSESASEAAEGIEVKDNLLFSALNAKGDASYPITYQSWVIVYAKQADKDKGAAVKAYLEYLIGDGQKLLKELDFAPLPKRIRDKAMKQLDKIVVR